MSSGCRYRSVNPQTTILKRASRHLPKMGPSLKAIGLVPRKSGTPRSASAGSIQETAGAAIGVGLGVNSAISPYQYRVPIVGSNLGPFVPEYHAKRRYNTQNKPKRDNSLVHRLLVRDQVLGPKSVVASWPIRKLCCPESSCRITPMSDKCPISPLTNPNSER